MVLKSDDSKKLLVAVNVRERRFVAFCFFTSRFLGQWMERSWLRGASRLLRGDDGREGANCGSAVSVLTHLSLGVFADFARHVVGALDQRTGDVVVIHRDDGQRDQEVHQEDHHGVDLRVHLIGQRVRHTVHEGDVSVVSVALRGEETSGEGGRRGDKWG